MTALSFAYARCSTDEQDLTVRREGMASRVGAPQTGSTWTTT
jgi:hypothetical protein